MTVATGGTPSREMLVTPADHNPEPVYGWRYRVTVNIHWSMPHCSQHVPLAVFRPGYGRNSGYPQTAVDFTARRFASAVLATAIPSVCDLPPPEGSEF